MTKDEANEALDKMADNARELGLDYEPAQKRPQNCGTGYCSCIECVMEPAQQEPVTDEENETFSRDVSKFKGTDEAATMYALEKFLRNRRAEQPEQQEPWLLESTQTLAKNLARKFYPEVTQWECLNDLAGVISQIDNMTTGLIRNSAQQEPVVWMYVNKSTHETKFQKHMRDFIDHSLWSEVPLYGEPLANHELQCICGAIWLGDEMVHLPDKRLPPQRTWVGLTDEEVWDLWNSHTEEPFPEWFVDFKRAYKVIEAKLKEKNT